MVFYAVVADVAAVAVARVRAKRDNWIMGEYTLEMIKKLATDAEELD